MRVMIDLTEPLHEWTSLLSDLQFDAEDLHTTIMYYDPLSDPMFLDTLVESNDPSISDDFIVFIKNSADELLRGKLDEYMRSLGYEVISIIKVFMTSITGVILSLIDVEPLYIGDSLIENTG